MAREKITIMIDEKTVVRLDRLVRQGVYPNRRRAIEDAVDEKLERLDRRRLARECEKLDVNFEEKMAEEGLRARLRTRSRKPSRASTKSSARSALVKT